MFQLSGADRHRRSKGLVFALCLWPILAGCQTEFETCCVLPNKDIVLDQYGDFSVIDGTHTVFEYYHEVPDPPLVLDAGMSQRLVFQIDSNVTGFTVADADLGPHRAMYRYSGFSPYAADHPVSSGVIAGAEVFSMKWLVDIDVVITLRAVGGEISTSTKELHLRREFPVRP